MDVINQLKVRSGKTLKVKTLHSFELTHEQEVFFLVLFANLTCKFAVLMRNTHQTANKIVNGKTFSLKNMTHQESVGTIEVFKVSDKSCFRESKLAENDPQTFSPDEIALLKQIQIAEYYNVVDLVVPVVLPQIASAVNLTLSQHSLMNSRDIREDQFVEVGYQRI